MTVILVADALVGDNGYLEHRKERQRHEAVRRALAQTQRENHALRDRARRLKEANPVTIEELARRKLGMIKPGEVLFIVKDDDAVEPGREP